jgi:hypothetical protein
MFNKNFTDNDIIDFLTNNTKLIQSFIIKSSIEGKTNNKIVKKYCNIALYLHKTIQNDNDPTYNILLQNAVSEYILKENKPKKVFEF